MTSREILELAFEASEHPGRDSALMTMLRDPPLLTTATFERRLPDGNRDLRPDEHVFLTSGTRGTRRQLTWSDEEISKNAELERTILAEHLGTLSPCAVDLGTDHPAYDGLPGGVLPGLAGFAVLPEGVARLLQEVSGPTQVVSPSLRAVEKVRLIGELGPQVLYTRRSLFERLLEVEQGELRTLRRVILVGERCPPDWLDFTAHRLGLSPRDILDGYGSVEVGIIAHRCRRCERYHYSDTIIPELISPAQLGSAWGDGLDPPDQGVLVVSSTIRRRTRVLRFVTEDIVRGHGHSPCHGRLQLGFDAIVGRLGYAHPPQGDVARVRSRLSV